MVDYSFVEDKVGRIEFAPEPSGVPAKRTATDPVKATRLAMKKGAEEVAKMVNEAKEFKIKNDSDFARATEIIGQMKTLKNNLKKKGETFYKDEYNLYKQKLRIVNNTVEPIDDGIEALSNEQKRAAYQMEMKRREDEAKARKEAADLQRKIDKQAADQRAAELKAAKKEKREPVELPPIVVDVPTVPKEIKAKTEHGTVSVKMVLKHEITELESEFIFALVLANCRPAYRTMADQACKKAIKAGALGIAGGPGVTVREEADTQHRRR